MELILYRHGKPIISTKEPISGAMFPKWLDDYRDSEIHPDGEEKNIYQLTYSSTLPRAITTAQMLGERNIAKEEFREAELPKIIFPRLSLRANIWVIFARIFWLLGYSKECESHKDFKARISSVASWMEQNQKEDRICLVTHGWFIRSLVKELKKRNWRETQCTGSGFFSHKIMKRIG